VSGAKSFVGHATSCALPSALPRRSVRAALSRALAVARPAASKQVPARLPLPDTFRF
jgi:hypothetical protein